MFDSYNIRRVSDNCIVDIDEVDKLVTEHFHLELRENDYGHFLLTLEEDEKERYGHFQKSISWVGLLHIIIYHTKVDYGKKSVYELLGALIIMRKRCVFFPRCADKMIVELAEFLQEQGLYVHANYNDSGRELHCVNPYNYHTMWKNLTGIFESDEHGVLLEFYPSIKNLSLDRNSYPTVQPCVKEMVIPEGITSISSRFFSHSRISEGIEFPNSLVDIGGKSSESSGSGAFFESFLPYVAFPQSLESIETHSFWGCHIRRLRLTNDQLRRFPENCFMGTEIETLHLPWNMKSHIDDVMGIYFPKSHVYNIEFDK